LLLRLLAGIALIYFGAASVLAGPPLTTVILQMAGTGTGIFLLIGLWTPVAGTLAAVVKVWIAFSRYSSHSVDPGLIPVWIAIVQAILSAVLAMLGPGAWSIDARLFGRRRIDVPER
jgi:uncharacterized membrane protein YphA (DoxX/SURF4 family)